MSLSSLANDGVLPTDVLRDVLLRLPADALCRLRLVCRSWRQLTSDPTFAEAHSRRHPLVVALPSRHGWHRCQHQHRCFEVQFVDPLSGNIVKRMRMARHWGGGHELSVHHGRIYIYPNEYKAKVLKNAFVLNPATGAVTMFPSTGIVAELGNQGESFNWSTSVLGWVPSTGEYKVLRVHRHWPQYPLIEIEQSHHVATLGGDGSRDDVVGWRVRPCPPVQIDISSPLRRAVVKGVAYFLAEQGKLYSDAIVAFDLATEEWRPPTLRGPLTSHNINAKKEYNHITASSFLANLNGCLVSSWQYMKNNYLYDICSMDLWFLEDVEKELWTKRYTVRSSSVIDPRGRMAFILCGS